jgi:hypothetical protein
MTIINYPSDGLYPELIALFRVVASVGEIDKESAIKFCACGATSAESLTRLRAITNRWTSLGLFVVANDKTRVNQRFEKRSRESLEEYTNRLPSFCRSVLLEEQNCLPLWGESPGTSADFVRGAAWLMSQNIYGLPSTRIGIEPIESEQVGVEKSIFTNDVRWNGIRHWMRFLGFATGDSSSFQIDPTRAVKAELAPIFGDRRKITGKEFLDSLAIRLPILDFGQYRKEVEESLNAMRWKKPAVGHLSMSLSLALRRLSLDNVIRLEGIADTGSSYRLTGMNYRTWGGFESVSWMGTNA